MLQWRFDTQGSGIHSDFPRSDGHIDIRDTTGGLVFGPYLDLPAGRCTARFLISGDVSGAVEMDMSADFGQRVIASTIVDTGALNGQHIELSADIGEPLSQFEVRLRAPEIVTLQVTGLEIDLQQPAPAAPTADRPVGTESRKSYAEKLENGFLARYLSGEDVLEVGYRGYVEGNVPIVPQAIGVDVGYPGYNGVRLPFADASFDAIYSSHCFEHIADYQAVLYDWYRLLKVGGYMIIVVPHQYLFEKRQRLPSRTNHDHKRFYTPDSLLAEIREALPVNGYRVRHLADQDKDYNYMRPPLDHAEGRFEIEVVVEKIEPPYWNLDDDTVRIYSAGEFLSREEFMFRGPRPDPFVIVADLAQPGPLFTGPHIDLQRGGYRANYYFTLWPTSGILERANLQLEIAVGSQSLRRRPMTAGELEEGVASIEFENDGRDGRFEFRIVSDAPAEGKITFKGVDLEYAKVSPN